MKMTSPAAQSCYAWGSPGGCHGVPDASSAATFRPGSGSDEGHEGQGLGAGLLPDAITRLASLSKAIGCSSLLVHHETASAITPYINCLRRHPLHIDGVPLIQKWRGKCLPCFIDKSV